jgi:uncharacterized protein (TIGR00369 family)
VTAEEHFRGLERAYALAPVTAWYGARLAVGEGTAEVTIPVRTEFHHAAGAVHGSVYFRALDDAAFFAANSLVPDVLVLTVSFTVHFAAPVTAGELRAVGRALHQGGRLLGAATELRDADGRMLAHGSGIFTRSRIALAELPGYSEGPGP